jgi:hypothetical protein
VAGADPPSKVTSSVRSRGSAGAPHDELAGLLTTPPEHVGEREGRSRLRDHRRAATEREGPLGAGRGTAAAPPQKGRKVGKKKRESENDVWGPR